MLGETATAGSALTTLELRFEFGLRPEIVAVFHREELLGVEGPLGRKNVNALLLVLDLPHIVGENLGAAR